LEGISTKEAAGILNISQNAVSRAIARGRLLATKVGRDWVVNKESLEQYKSRKKGWQKGKKRKK